MVKSQNYRTAADYCLDRAAAASDPQARRAFQQAARLWNKLADQMAAIEAFEMPPNSADTNDKPGTRE